MAGQKLNPFATAMKATTETNGANGTVPKDIANNNQNDQEESLTKLFADMDNPLASQAPDAWRDLLTPQETKEKVAKDKLVREQHERVNPQDQHEIFAAQAEKDKNEEKQLVQELRELADRKQVPQVEQPKVLDAQVTVVGDRGTNGLIAKAKHFIETYTPQSWASAFETKRRKIKKGPGALTKQIQDTLHHERAMGAIGA